MPDREPIDPLLLALANAPEDDEPWTDEDEAAVAEGRADFAAGRTISHEELLRKYGWLQTGSVRHTDSSAQNTAFAEEFAKKHRKTFGRLAQ